MASNSRWSNRNCRICNSIGDNDVKISNNKISISSIIPNKYQPRKNFEKEGQAGVVESTKAASDVYTPVTGEITETNQSIVDDPATVNKDPEGASWFFKIKIKNKSELNQLMSKADYEKFAKENPN